MKNWFFILFFSLSLNLSAQGEANNWFFGQNAGIDFNGGTPTSVSGRINTNEGCASFSDKDGNLLFYTDGTVVYNKNHQRMPNGSNLLGNSSSTQSAIIVPHPGNKDQLYIFTVGAYWDNSTPGFNAYIVDMTLDNGLGDISQGPINLSDGKDLQWTEKVASVKGADCNTFWIISLVNSTFYSYKVDEINGLNMVPVKSTVNHSKIDNRGYLKVSPDGTKLASATFNLDYDSNNNPVIGNGNLRLYNFNNATGEITNNGTSLISNPNNDGEPYGVEFSPQSTKLYCSTFNGTTNKLFQFDLSNNNAKTLIKSQVGYRGGLQLAPDGKIYITVPVSYFQGTRFLHTINAPEKVGTDCNYQQNTIELKSGLAMQGLPPFIASFLLPIEITSSQNNTSITNTTINLCMGDNFEMKAENLQGNPTYEWKFTDLNGTISIINGQTLSLANVTDLNSGEYKLKVEATDECGGIPKIYEGIVNINVNENPVISSNIIYEQCDFDANPIDGFTTFNLTTREADLTNNNPNVAISFFELSDTNFQNPVNKNSYINTTAPNHTLNVKVEDINTGCSSIGTIDLFVLPTSLDTYEDNYTCEIDINSNNSTALKSESTGFGSFDFDVIIQNIKNVFLTPVNIELYRNSSDALTQTDPITGIQDFKSQEIFVRIENEATKSCEGGGTFNLIVNPLPLPNGNEEEQILCVSNPKGNPQPFTLTLNGDTGVPEDMYQWYYNNTIISGATNPIYEANAEGIYKVEATHRYENLINDTNDDTYCTGFNTFKIIESNPPVITLNDVTITDDSINNTITINNTNQNLGLGDYEFALVDTENNWIRNFQDEPYFDNVPPGILTVLINDKKGCGRSQIEISVIGYPKFFTPNNDGYNDSWKVLGVNENFYTNSYIYIFDRFGKLITQIDPKGNGWDGTFNGKILPASDYWFSVELIDENGNIRTKKGHFSLLR